MDQLLFYIKLKFYGPTFILYQIKNLPTFILYQIKNLPTFILYQIKNLPTFILYRDQLLFYIKLKIYLGQLLSLKIKSLQIQF